jgi:hypothetical protein
MVRFAHPTDKGMNLSTRITAAALLLALGAAAGMAYAQPAPGWREDFEGREPSWQRAGNDAEYRVVEHRRLQGDAHGGNGCEWLRLEAGGGSHVYFAHEVGRPRVIDDLTPSVWIRSDRPGMHLACRIVLPRTNDPHTGRPVTTIVTGSGYTDVGRWQELRIEQVPRLLTRQVHLLRTQLGPQVDERGAYVDAVLLNIYGGPGAENVWIDDLSVVGYVASESAPSTPPQGGAAGKTPLAPVRLPPVADSHDEGQSPSPQDSTVSWTPRGTVPVAAGAVPVPRHTVRLVGSVLLVDGRPMFPRIIQHRGEPIEVLKRLGFNAVWLQRLPAPELLEEANRLGLWLICPPPRGDCPNFRVGENGTVPFGAPTGPPPAALAEFGPQFDCVLAWDLGGDLTEAELESTQQWAQQVRAADRRGGRPLVCRPRTDLRGYSRPANLLLIDRRPVGTSLELADYATWIRQQPLLASLGTPVWTTVQTQPNAALREQLMSLEPGYVPPLGISPEQIRLLAYTAAAAGSRGLVFVSDSPLDASDPDTRQRAMTLELLNLELELIEPWAAAGNFVASAEASAPEVAGAVLGTEHSRLLLPIWSGPGAQYVPSQSAARGLALISPGVPESSTAYELTPHGVQSLGKQRVAGGVRITLDEFGLTAQVLLAHDPLVIDAVNHRAAQAGPRAAELQRNLAVHKLYTVQAIAGQLAARTPVRSSTAWFEAAQKSRQLCDGQLASGDVPGAALNAQRTGRSLRLIERAYWDAAVKELVSPMTSPAAVSFDTLPIHWRLIDRLRARPFGPNRLDGGDFEDIGVMLRAGWRNNLHAAPTVQAAVDLLPQAAHSGRLGVRLAIAPVDPKNPPAVIESPPILFSSPAVQVEAGQIVCIHGWVQVPVTITGSTDGLLVVDSLAGECLAERIGKTKGWRQFAMYRVAPQAGPMCVTFALSGMGEAWLDDVEIQILANP